MNENAQDEYKIDDIVLANPTDALAVIKQLKRLISDFGYFTMGDVYRTVGILSNSYFEELWGWTDISGVTVSITGPGSERVLSFTKPERIR